MAPARDFPGGDVVSELVTVAQRARDGGGDVFDVIGALQTAMAFVIAGEPGVDNRARLVRSAKAVIEGKLEPCVAKAWRSMQVDHGGGQ